MKKLIIIILAATAMFSCKKDNIVAVTKADPGAPAVTTPAANTAIIITETNGAEKLSVRWKKADYGVSTVLNYTLQAAIAGSNFSQRITLGNTSADSASVTYTDINNGLLNTLNAPANETSAIQIRIAASISGKDTVYSEPVTLSVTTFKITAPDRLYVPGAYQEWKPENAVFIRQAEGFTYEGYVYMKIGDYYKFTSAPDWVHINYGDSGTPGKLTEDGNASGLKVDQPGYYKFNVNTQELTYSAARIESFGLIGTATAGAWDNSTPMTYNESEGVWTVTANLTAGALKFRANNGWDINYGPADINALTGTLIQTNDAINITEAGSYTVTLDFSQETDKQYRYTVVKN
ncbi:SusF/SusE family outer membrane protein [Mucilaginibacter limnophilus]|uniref:SusF/SusE family outer membrane protein n=1 Tax=Mucilaginibacter limnophilus TaxID=1932778 RepID=A0A3S2V4B0_9SPHI|nr:SusE domain-containing protein [Mucilaginibacter limnophilus]RVU03055.1 SusF/SusE family outer membrane protein [Mucilaginibacter limnophilus]